MPITHVITEIFQRKGRVKATRLLAWLKPLFVGQYIALNFALALYHIASTLFVVIPVKGATKFKVWLTVPWANPSCGRFRYAAHISVHIVVFGSTHCRMIGSNVAWSLAGTGTRNPVFVSASYQPSIHCSLTRWPRSYFHRTNRLSSILTMCPFPPRRPGWFTKCWTATSRQN